MAYTPTEWKDHIVQHPNRFRVIDNGDGTVDILDEHGEILQQGTPVDASRLNKMENGIKEAHDLIDAHLNENVLLGDTPHGWVYEEGAFTPYLQPLEGAFANIEYSEQTGYYVRNGNLVWVYVHLSVNGTTLDVGTASGHLRIAGLPYVLKGDAPYQFSSVPRSFRWNTDDRTLGMYGRGFPGTAIIGLYKQLRPNDDILIAQEEITVAHLRQSSDPFINILAFSFQYLI